jgi:chitinase
MSRPVISTLRAPAAALLLIGSAAVASPAFADNDFVSLSSASVTEGDSGQTSMVFTASVANPPSAPITMRFATSANHTTLQPGDATPGSACGGTVDFVAVDGTITIPANANPPQVTVSVPVCGDTAIEGNETFTAVVSNVQGAGAYCLEVCASHGLIVDNDTAQPLPIQAPPSLSVANASAGEGNELFTPHSRLYFVVSLSAASTNTVTVGYGTLQKGTGSVATGGPSCLPGVDFITTSGTLQFNPGETHKTVIVQVCGDTLNEPNETMLLRLSNPTGATIADGIGVGTIVDDD